MLPSASCRMQEARTNALPMECCVCPMHHTIVDGRFFAIVSAAMPDRKDGVYLLPAATQLETSGSVTASNRSIQWREKVIDPLFESRPDHAIMLSFAKKFGFGAEFVKNIKLVKVNAGTKNEYEEPLVEEIGRAHV